MPAFPTTTCAILLAQQATMTVSGSPEPTSETAFDTARIQTAMNGCAATPGSTVPMVAVELAASGANNAFLFQLLTIPVGVALVVDGGVTLFASRNPCDYQAQGTTLTSGSPNYCVGGSKAAGSGTYCGQFGNHYTCLPMITIASDPTGTENTVGSAIMGYGTIDGRGTDTLIGPNVPTTAPYTYNLTPPYSYYQMTLAAYANGGGGSQATPILISAPQASNFVLYKITLMNAPYYNVKWYNSTLSSVTSGFTAWGIKILAPNNVENTDGIDPEDYIKDITIAYSYISNGDDQIALDSYAAAGYPATDVTINHVYTFSGFGISVGTGVEGGVSNVLIENATQNGTVLNSAFPEPVLSTGFHIKSTAAAGGIVNNVTYENSCMRNQAAPIRITPFNYGTGTSIPTFSNISISNVTVEPNVSFNGTPVSGLTNYFYFGGYDSTNVTTVTLNNLYSYATPTFTFPTDQTVGVPEYVNFTLGPAAGVYFPSPATLSSITSLGPGITIAGTPPAATPQTCTFPQLNGELYLAVADKNLNNAQSASIAFGDTVVLNAVVQPSAEEFPALSQGVAFYEGDTQVGYGTITTNSTGNFVTASIQPAVGTHTYTAQYSGSTSGHQDANYAAAFPFGSVSVTVIAGPGIALTPSVTTLPVTHGSSGMLTLSVLPTGGYSGTVALTCSSPVSYVTCSIATPVLTVSGTTASTSSATITVAATTGEIRRFDNTIVLAMLAPFVLLLALGRRRRLPRVCSVVALVLVGAVLSGCGGGSTPAASGGGGTVPSGTQTVTFTATSGTYVQTAQVAVAIQ